MALAMTSCGDIFSDDIDVNNLYGKWREGSVYEHYYTDGTGITWDEADDTSEEEGQPFDWTLDGKTLIQEHRTIFGSVVPKVYTVTELTSSSLIYSDDYGKSHYFTKAY